MGTLNRSRPYAIVYGIADHTYEQDGKLYDHNGNEVVKEEQPVSVADAKATEGPASVSVEKEPAKEAVSSDREVMPEDDENPKMELPSVAEDANGPTNLDPMQENYLQAQAETSTAETVNLDSMSRQEIMKYLSRLNVPFKRNARKSVLKVMLQEALLKKEE